MTDFAAQVQNYLYGECHIFAIALHKLTGYPIVMAVEHPSNPNDKTLLVHAWVRNPEGLAIDASGTRDENWMLQKYESGMDSSVYVASVEELNGVVHRVQELPRRLNQSFLRATKMAAFAVSPGEALRSCLKGEGFNDLTLSDAKSILFAMADENPDLFAEDESAQEAIDELSAGSDMSREKSYF